MSKNKFTITLLSSVLTGFSFLKLNAQEGIVTINQDRDIERLLVLKKEVNSNDLNYTLRVFRGERADAEKAHTMYKHLFGDWKSNLEYNYPRYEVWIGNFKTRLQADRELVKIKNKCGMAFKNEPELKRACRSAFVLKPKPKDDKQDPK